MKKRKLRTDRFRKKIPLVAVLVSFPTLGCYRRPSRLSGFGPAPAATTVLGAPEGPRIAPRYV
eukprot:3999246-Amphidinium_carterae.1